MNKIKIFFLFVLISLCVLSVITAIIYLKNIKIYEDIKVELKGVNYGSKINLYGFARSNILTSDFIKYIPSVHENLNHEIKKMGCENSGLQFPINYMTRSFFSNMYGGSYGSWLMTYRFPIEWSLPFLDKNILKILLSMPLEFLLRKDLKFYNQIYKDNFPSLINIPTSSHFGEIPGSCIDYYQFGKEPKNEKQARYVTAFEKVITFPASKELNIFDFSGILKYKKQENHPNIRPFIEFEMWYKHVSNI